MHPTLVILAAGMGSRYGGLKQVDPVGPNRETIMDYAVFDALAAGFHRVVFVIRREFEAVFRETIGAKYVGVADVAYAFQEIDDLPPGFEAPSERNKPWGTAHAIRAARQVVDTPFAAINADDFYGRDAFARMGAFLAQTPPGLARPRFAMAGYRLDRTLSPHGAVARGVCRVDDQNRLVAVTELTRLVRTPEGIENRENPGQPLRLSGAERVSMNCWGFTPALFAALERRFPLWLQAHAHDPKAEWYIPFVVDELIRDRAAEVAVLPVESDWFGVTYREDREAVRAAVQALIRDGAYPARLW